MAATPTRGSLHSKTLTLLRESDQALIDIYDQTKLPYHWLKKFSSGEIQDPSVNRVQCLYEFLAQRKLKV